MGLAWTAAALLFLAVPAAAQDRPRLMPTRDLDVTYRVTKPGEPRLRERVRWLASEQLERIDSPGGITVIADHRNHSTTELVRSNHSYLKLDAQPREFLAPESQAPFTHGGTAMVAGLSCTVWAWQDPETLTPSSACVTDDGLLLRTQENGQTVLQAVSVQYRALKPATFEVPSSYEPSLAPGGPAAP